MGFFNDLTDGLGLTNDKSTDKAIAAQAAAMREANRIQKEMYDQTRADQEPWRAAGQNALGDMQSLALGKDFAESDGHFKGHSGVFSMKDFVRDPGYKFRMAEGQRAIDRSAAASGGMNSGATLKALSRYGQGIASSEYQNSYNRFNSDYNNSYNRFNQNRNNKFSRYSNIAGLGQGANSINANAGANYGNRVSANHVGMGNARAAAELNRKNLGQEIHNRGMEFVGAAMGGGYSGGSQGGGYSSNGSSGYSSRGSGGGGSAGGSTRGGFGNYATMGF